MTSLFLALALLTSAVAFSVHFFVGGRVVAAPLLANASLPRPSKWLNYMTWHIASIYLAMLPFAYGWHLWQGTGREMILFITILNAGAGAMSVTAARIGGIAPWRFPSTNLFILMTLFGTLALLG